MKGIMFRPEMHKAIAENRKTVTRRLDGLKEINKESNAWSSFDVQEGIARFKNKWTNNLITVKPRYRVGEVVYIKETTCIECYGRDGVKDACYKTDEDGGESIEIDCNSAKWNSPMFMFAWAARYFIMITAVTPERLQEITEGEAMAEGWPYPQYKNTGVLLVGNLRTTGFGNVIPTARSWFKELWDSINKSQKWDTNPFVWRYSFAKADKPIGIERGEDNAS